MHSSRYEYDFLLGEVGRPRLWTRFREQAGQKRLQFFVVRAFLGGDCQQVDPSTVAGLRQQLSLVVNVMRLRR